jgi:hypothetical protein
MKYPDFWHQPVSCENLLQIQKEIKECSADQISKMMSTNPGFEHIEDLSKFCQATPALQSWLSKLNCSNLHQAALIILKPRFNQNIHTDAQRNDLALNIGLQVLDTYTQMYEIVQGEPHTVSYGTQGLVYISYNQCELKPHTSFSLEESPVLFNTKHVHNVVNNTDKHRIAVSLRFQQDPDHLFNH